MPDYPKDDCYDALGVDHEASQDLIHATYIKLVKIYHPDPLSNASARDRAAAQEKLKRINEAYEILKDPVRRQNYDDWSRQKRQPPRPRVTPDELDFGTLDPDQSRTIRLTLENDGGPVTGEINFSMSRDPSYFRVGVNPSSGFPILVDVTFDRSTAGGSGDFADSLTVTLDGAAAHASLRARVRLASATSAPAHPFAAPSHHSGRAGATPPPHFASSPTAPPSSPSGLSRGWAIALGWFVFVILLFFGEAIAQNVARLRPQAPGWLPGATFYSLFGAAALAGVMTTGLLQAKRTRATIAALLAAASTVTFFVLLGVGASGLSQPALTPGPPNLSSAAVPARAGERPQILDCRHLSLRLYNIDDDMQASLTNATLGSQVILQVPERQDTGFVDLGSRTQPGINTLSLQLMNYRGGYTYGYQLRSDSTIVDQASCGQVGIVGCNNNDFTRGLVFKHAFTFECPGATEQTGGAKAEDGDHGADASETSKSTTPSDTPDDTRPDTAQPAVGLEWESISFSMGPCSTRLDSVVCATRILNNGDDRRIRLGLARDSRIIDDTGREFPVSGGELGANNCRGCDVSGTLVRGVPIVGRISFGDSRRTRPTVSDANSSILAIAVLELRANIEERGWNTLQFRNVPIQTAGTAEHRKPPPADAKADTPESAVTRNLEEISFSIGPCSARSDSIVCAARVLNKGTDRRIRLGIARDSRVIDDSGHEFPVIGGELGANTCRGCDVSSTLVSGVPMVGSVSFGDPRRSRATVTDVNTAISAIAVLELRVNVEERGWNTLQFRNVPITK
jgi:curved DNA-binding protein CbpA